MSYDKTISQNADDLLRARRQSSERLRPPTEVPGYEFERFLADVEQNLNWQRPQVERWFTSNGLRAKAVGWHQESEREEAALARQDVLESQLDSAQPPRPKVRM